MNVQPTLKQLKYLRSIEDTGSFSAAAERCFVTQSTLSAGIKELETIFGATLVNRANMRAIALTPLGKTVSTRAKDILSAVDSLIEEVAGPKAPLTGPLRLGVIPTIAPYFLPDLLPKIQHTFPNLELQIQEGLSKDITSKLHQGKLDVILLAFPFETPGAKQAPIFTERFYLAAHKERSLPKAMTLEQLESETLLLLEDGHCLRDHALSACTLQRLQERRNFSATSLATLIQMVGHGYGVTLLPDMVVKSGGLPGTIRTVPFQGNAPERTIGLAWKPAHPHATDYDLLANTIKRLHPR